MQPDMTNDPSGLMRKRAETLAYVYLTRRNGAVVEAVGSDTGIDLVVTLPARKRAGVRQLGVAIRFALESVTADGANNILRQSWPVPDFGPFPIPVVLFFFTMRDNRAWYSWLAEPVVSANRSSQLPLHGEPDAQPLTDESLNELLDRVDGWYDAHYDDLAAVVPAAKRVRK